MDEQSTISLDINQQAIEAALDCRWQDAITLNSQIIKTEPESVDALNRIAHAYFESGNLKLARKNYSLVLDIDPYNPIAAKNLKIIQAFKKDDDIKPSQATRRISISLFLQEPGKTKNITLLKAAEPHKLSQLRCGMQADLVPKNRGITVVDEAGEYLGVLPDDIAFSLLRLIKGGNKYQSFIKSIKVNGLTILVREIYRSAKFKNQPSFLEYSNIKPTREFTPTIEDDTKETEANWNSEEEQD